MKQDMIVILDLGSHENTVLARAIRALGVYSEIYPHDITAAELKALPNVKGVIINGGPNNVIDGVEIDVLPEIYEAGYPVMAAGHDKALCEVKLAQLTDDEEAIKAAVKSFVFDTCKAEANWNMKNFVNDQVELVRRQVGDRKVLLALSGGVDSSVVAALLLKAIGDNLVCVHVNHGLMRKMLPSVSLQSWRVLRTPSRSVRLSAASSSAYSRRRPASWTVSTSSARVLSIPTSWRVVQRLPRWLSHTTTWVVYPRICSLSW